MARPRGGERSLTAARCGAIEPRRGGSAKTQVGCPRLRRCQNPNTRAAAPSHVAAP